VVDEWEEQERRLWRERKKREQEEREKEQQQQPAGQTQQHLEDAEGKEEGGTTTTVATVTTADAQEEEQEGPLESQKKRKTKTKKKRTSKRRGKDEADEDEEATQTSSGGKAISAPASPRRMIIARHQTDQPLNSSRREWPLRRARSFSDSKEDGPQVKNKPKSSRTLSSHSLDGGGSHVVSTTSRSKTDKKKDKKTKKSRKKSGTSHKRKTIMGPLKYNASATDGSFLQSMKKTLSGKGKEKERKRAVQSDGEDERTNGNQLGKIREARSEPLLAPDPSSRNEGTESPPPSSHHAHQAAEALALSGREGPFLVRRQHTHSPSFAQDGSSLDPHRLRRSDELNTTMNAVSGSLNPVPHGGGGSSATRASPLKMGSASLFPRRERANSLSHPFATASSTTSIPPRSYFPPSSPSSPSPSPPSLSPCSSSSSLSLPGLKAITDMSCTLTMPSLSPPPSPRSQVSTLPASSLLHRAPSLSPRSDRLQSDLAYARYLPLRFSSSAPTRSPYADVPLDCPGFLQPSCLPDQWGKLVRLPFLLQGDSFPLFLLWGSHCGSASVPMSA